MYVWVPPYPQAAFPCTLGDFSCGAADSTPQEQHPVPHSAAADSPSGQLVAAFPTALHAARWALSVQEALNTHTTWPEALLQHPLCAPAQSELLDAHPTASASRSKLTPTPQPSAAPSPPPPSLRLHLSQKLGFRPGASGSSHSGSPYNRTPTHTPAMHTGKRSLDQQDWAWQEHQPSKGPLAGLELGPADPLSPKGTPRLFASYTTQGNTQGNNSLFELPEDPAAFLDAEARAASNTALGTRDAANSISNNKNGNTQADASTNAGMSPNLNSQDASPGYRTSRTMLGSLYDTVYGAGSVAAAARTRGSSGNSGAARVTALDVRAAAGGLPHDRASLPTLLVPHIAPRRQRTCGVSGTGDASACRTSSNGLYGTSSDVAAMAAAYSPTGTAPARSSTGSGGGGSRLLSRVLTGRLSGNGTAVAPLPLHLAPPAPAAVGGTLAAPAPLTHGSVVAHRPPAASSSNSRRGALLGRSMLGVISSGVAAPRPAGFSFAPGSPPQAPAAAVLDGEITPAEDDDADTVRFGDVLGVSAVIAGTVAGAAAPPPQDASPGSQSPCAPATGPLRSAGSAGMVPSPSPTVAGASGAHSLQSGAWPVSLEERDSGQAAIVPSSPFVIPGSDPSMGAGGVGLLTASSLEQASASPMARSPLPRSIARLGTPMPATPLGSSPPSALGPRGPSHLALQSSRALSQAHNALPMSNSNSSVTQTWLQRLGAGDSKPRATGAAFGCVNETRAVSMPANAAVSRQGAVLSSVCNTTMLSGIMSADDTFDDGEDAAAGGVGNWPQMGSWGGGRRQTGNGGRVPAVGDGVWWSTVLRGLR